MLTKEEALIAAERAWKYPPGWGGVFIAWVSETDNSTNAWYWLKEHPEDLEKG